MDETYRTIVQLVLVNETGDSYYRMRWPSRDLAYQNPKLRVINLDAQAKERFQWGEAADLLVLYQSNDPDMLPLIEKRRRTGKKTLVEYNDNFYAAPAWSPVADAWDSPLLWQRYEHFMKISDGVIVTGEGLKGLLSSHVQQRYLVIENHLPERPAHLESLRQRKTPYVSIGWGGSLGHMADLLAVLPVIKEVLAQFPTVKFHVMGNSSIPSLLGIPENRFEYTNWGTMDEYFAFWDKAHMGIAPLLDTAYNHGRSDIKAVEMSSRGVLPVLSDALPYRSFLGATDLSPFESFQDLKALLVDYISNREAVDRDVQICHSYVSSKRVGIDRTERLNVYEECMSGVPQSAFPWPFGTGYHEVQGTPFAQPIQQSVFQQVNQLFKQGKVNEAVPIIEAFANSQSLNSDACYAKLKCLRAAGRSDFLTQVQEAAFRFSDDMRFPLLALESETEPRVLEEKWRGFLKRLQSLPPNYARFFADDILSVFLKQLGRVPALVPIASLLISIYPNNVKLHYELGEMLRSIGADKEALEHFEWLCDVKEIAQENKGAIDKIERNYIEAWKSALAARVKSNTR